MKIITKALGFLIVISFPLTVNAAGADTQLPDISDINEKSYYEVEKVDTRIGYHLKTESSDIAATLMIAGNAEESHSINNRQLGELSYELIDHGRRFAYIGNWGRSVVSGLEISFGGKQVRLNGFPSNQIYGFLLREPYGSFPCYNKTVPHKEYDLDATGERAINLDHPRIIMERKVGGTYFTPNATADSLLVNLADGNPSEEEMFVFSAILARKTGEWFIFPEDYNVGYNAQYFAKMTILDPGGTALPETPAKICYEYNERKQPSIRLELEAAPDNLSNHKIEKTSVNGRDVVLIDGKPRMYDPASPIRWKLAGAHLWWDGKPVELKGFPSNHFFNFPISNPKWPAKGEFKGGMSLIGEMLDPKPNCIGIYPSTDRKALYVGFSRKDETSGIVSYAVLIIAKDGRCDVFPESFDAYVNDKGQNVTALEGYSDKALKRPPVPAAPKKVQAKVE